MQWKTYLKQKKSKRGIQSPFMFRPLRHLFGALLVLATGFCFTWTRILDPMRALGSDVFITVLFVAARIVFYIVVYDFQTYNISVSLMNHAFGKEAQAKARRVRIMMESMIAAEIFCMMCCKCFVGICLAYEPISDYARLQSGDIIDEYHILYLAQQSITIFVLILAAVWIITMTTRKMREFDKAVESAFKNDLKKLFKIKKKLRVIKDVQHQLFKHAFINGIIMGLFVVIPGMWTKMTYWLPITYMSYASACGKVGIQFSVTDEQRDKRGKKLATVTMANSTSYTLAGTTTMDGATTTGGSMTVGNKSQGNDEGGTQGNHDFDATTGVQDTAVEVSLDFTEEGDYPGEDIESAEFLRIQFMIPQDQLFTIKSAHDAQAWGMWCGRYPIASAKKIPIVVCSGGTGVGMFYKQFADKLADMYEGPVFIWDRLNMGLSDRYKRQTNGPVLWSNQLSDMMEQQGIEKAHFVAISLASVIMTHFHSMFPKKCASIAMISGILGGFGANNRNVVSKMGITCIFLCLRKIVGDALFRMEVIPKLYDRCEGQVLEGGDPAGVAVAKAAYRIKGTAKALYSQFMATPMIGYTMNKLPDKFFEKMAADNLPMYMRGFTEDDEMDLPGLHRAFAMVCKGNTSKCEKSEARGKHHKFYKDSTGKLLVNWFRDLNGEDRYNSIEGTEDSVVEAKTSNATADTEIAMVEVKISDDTDEESKGNKREV